jgi:hypothetical protein
MLNGNTRIACTVAANQRRPEQRSSASIFAASSFSKDETLLDIHAVPLL